MPVILETGALATATANDIISRAYRILGDLGTGEALTAAQADDGLEALNAMVDSFSIERLMIYHVRQESLTWPANTTSRTIGDGGDFDTHRPDRVENGTYFEDANSIAYAVDVIRNRSVYDNIYDKTVTSSYPEILFYDPSMTLGTLYVYPVPASSLTLKLNSWQPLQVFDSLTETLTLPPGYRRMLAYNLAKELEAESGLVLSMGAHQIANKSKAIVKRQNSLPIISQTESAYVLHGRGRSDIVAGK